VGSDQLAFGADGRLLVEGTDRLLRTFSPDGVGERLVERRALASFPGGGGVISADGRVLASITADGSTAELLDATTGRSLSTIAGLPPQSTAMLALSPDGTKVAVLSAHFVTDPFQSHMIAAVYDTATGRALWSVETDLFFASGATFDPSGSMLAIVGANSTTFNAPVAIELLDATSGARLGTPVSVAPFASAPQFSADGRLIAVVNGAFGPSQGPVLYGVAEHRVVRTLGDPRLADISTFQFSADGKTAIAVSNDTGHVYVLDATTFAIRSDFDTGAGGGSVFALNADGSHLAVVSANALQIFDTATGQTIGAPVASTDVRAIAFADDDTTLVGFSGAGLERIDVDVTSWSGQACTIAGRNLTRAEWTAALGSDVPYQSTCPALPPGP
jgi:WD40 repeat protein